MSNNRPIPVRISPALIRRADRLKSYLQRRDDSALKVTRSTVLRAAVLIGLERLEAERARAELSRRVKGRRKR